MSKQLKEFFKWSLIWAAVVLASGPGCLKPRGADSGAKVVATWELGTPIVTYWAGPPLTDAVAQQMAEGGWNLVWCTNEQQLDIAQRHGLRAQFQHGLLSSSVDQPAQREQLAALVARVRTHPALYNYFIQDEPSAADFPALGRSVAYLRELDPQHKAYINLFPTYASNKQLGTTGDTLAAYQEHLRQFIAVVKPSLLSYDHYQFRVAGDTGQYFLNLALLRESAQQACLPFLNIVQACSWDPAMRVPTGNELRYLVYTTLAYGAQGISYYVYCWPKHVGGIALPDGTPTPLYHALKTLNREFVAIATECQPLRSSGVYIAGTLAPGTTPLPPDAPFHFDPPVPSTPGENLKPVQGLLLGCFGPADKGGAPTYVLVVNLDYKTEVVTTLVGPGNLDVFDATSKRWTRGKLRQVELHLPAGGGKLVRIHGASL